MMENVILTSFTDAERCNPLIALTMRLKNEMVMLTYSRGNEAKVKF